MASVGNAELPDIYEATEGQQLSLYLSSRNSKVIDLVSHAVQREKLSDNMRGLGETLIISPPLSTSSRAPPMRHSPTLHLFMHLSFRYF